jgi:2-methylcitrate dehydratase PrpD
MGRIGRVISADSDLVRGAFDGNRLLDLQQTISFNKVTDLCRRSGGAKALSHGVAIFGLYPGKGFEKLMKQTGQAGRAINHVSGIWGDFIARSQYQDIPASIVHEAKRSILNVFGTALGAAREPAVAAAIEVLRPFSGPPQATIIGRTECLDVLSASFINALSANFFEFDDTHLRTVIHPSAPVVPPLLALAELRGLTGAQIIHACVLGIEMECRLGNSVSPSHYSRGWHITATCGVFGAAAASAKLLDLGGGQTANSIGVAASLSAGLVENLTTGAKNVGVGNAARNGVVAALMAERGYTAAPQALEGTLGWALATGEQVRIADLVVGLGENWELASNTYKPYPCGIVVHPVIDACFKLRRKRGIRAVDINTVTVAGPALLAARADRAVETERDAKVSVHHSVATVFLFDAAGLREYSSEMVADPEVAAIRSKVRVGVDLTIPMGGARVSVHTVGGEIVSEEVAYAHGSQELPMSDAELETKVRNLAHWGAKNCDVDHLIEAIWNLDEAANVSTLMDRLRLS